MSGHSKWATIKRKKAKIDAARGKVFTRLTKEIILAAKLGGGDPAGNMRLKSCIEKAKEANIPKESIQRAIMKGTGQLNGSNMEEIVYEGYGPSGVAVMINIMTDNRNRTAGEVRHMFSKNGGNLGETGCVSWMFDRKGLLVIDREECNINEDELMLLALDAGAEDVKADEDEYEIYTGPEDFIQVLKNLEEQNISVAEAEVTYVPQTTVKLQGEEEDKMLRLIDLLEELDDVDDVFTNLDTEE